MDLPTLITELEGATFAHRASIAATVARSATPELLKQVGRLLVHPNEDVRLGAIEILAAAEFRPALGVLLEITRKRDGAERVFAARAVAHLCQPGDRDAVEPAAREWLATGDEYLVGHAEAALAKVGGGHPTAAAGAAVPSVPSVPTAGVPGPGASADAGAVLPGMGITAPDPAVRHPALARLRSAADPVEHIVTGLRETGHAGVRLDLVAELERLGGAALARGALALMPRLDGDTAALLARALARAADAVPADQVAAVRAAVDQTWRNLAGEALAREALEACLRALPA